MMNGDGLLHPTSPRTPNHGPDNDLDTASAPLRMVQLTESGAVTSDFVCKRKWGGVVPFVQTRLQLYSGPMQLGSGLWIW